LVATEVRPDEPGRRRPPRRPRRTAVRRAGDRGRYRVGRARALHSARALAPASPPATDADAGPAIFGTRAGGLLRYGLPPRACRGRRSICPPRRLIQGRRPPVRLPWPVVRVHRPAAG